MFFSAGSFAVGFSGNHRQFQRLRFTVNGKFRSGLNEGESAIRQRVWLDVSLNSLAMTFDNGTNRFGFTGNATNPNVNNPQTWRATEVKFFSDSGFSTLIDTHSTPSISLRLRPSSASRT